MAKQKNQFCKFCGSQEIRYVKSNSGLTVDKMIDPQVGIVDPNSGMNFNVKIFSWTKGKKKELLVKTNQCRVCRNIDVVDNTVSNHPITLISSAHNTGVVIPFILERLFHNNQYTEREIAVLVNELRDRLGSIYKSWTKKGINPCRGNHVGKKIKIALTNGMMTWCWVIVDTLDRDIVFRLTYGGRDIECD
jgi:hypothetical protein